MYKPKSRRFPARTKPGQDPPQPLKGERPVRDLAGLGGMVPQLQPRGGGQGLRAAARTTGAVCPGSRLSSLIGGACPSTEQDPAFPRSSGDRHDMKAPTTGNVRTYQAADFEATYSIINDATRAYRTGPVVAHWLYLETRLTVTHGIMPSAPAHGETNPRSADSRRLRGGREDGPWSVARQAGAPKPAPQQSVSQPVTVFALDSHRRLPQARSRGWHALRSSERESRNQQR